jgi:hypothetical protein
MVVALPPTYVADRVIESMSNQTNNYQIGICTFYIMSAPLIIRVGLLCLPPLQKQYFNYIATVRKYNLYLLLLC